MWRLITNPVYIVTCLGACMELMIVSGFVVFLPKYLETQFSLGKSQASVFTGSIAIPGACVGIFIGGLFLKRFQLKPKGAVQFVLVSNVVCLACYALLFFLGCDNVKMAGTTIPYHNNTSHLEPFQVNLTAACNTGCECPMTDVEPVCGNNGLTYFSPCHAGCTASSSSNYSNCACKFYLVILETSLRKSYSRCSHKRHKTYLRGHRRRSSARTQLRWSFPRSDGDTGGDRRSMPQALPNHLPISDTSLLHDVYRRVDANAFAHDRPPVGVGRGAIVCARHAVCDFPLVRLHTSADPVRESHRFVVPAVAVVVREIGRSLLDLRHREVPLQVHRLMHRHQSRCAVDILRRLVAREKAKASRQARSDVGQ